VCGEASQLSSACQDHDRCAQRVHTDATTNEMARILTLLPRITSDPSSIPRRAQRRPRALESARLPPRSTCWTLSRNLAILRLPAGSGSRQSPTCQMCHDTVQNMLLMTLCLQRIQCKVLSLRPPFKSSSYRPRLSSPFSGKTASLTHTIFVLTRHVSFSATSSMSLISSI